MLKHTFFLITLLFVVGCNPGDKHSVKTLNVESWLPLRIGEVNLQAQIALTAEEQRQGLMHRDALPENCGMLFPYENPQQLSFWMANTRIPLDIAFFDVSGLLLEIHRMAPYDRNSTRSHSAEVQFALEMNAGWFKQNRLYPGQRLDLDVLAAALRARGADPARFGLQDN